MKTGPYITSCCIAVLLSFLVLPLICLLTLFLALYKRIILLYHRIRNADFHAMPSEDSYFISNNPYQQSERELYIRFLLVFEGNMTLEKLRESFWKICSSHEGGNKLLMAPVNKNTFWFWRNCSDSFNIKDHVVYMHGNAYNKTVTADELFDKFNKIVIPPPEGKPLWRIAFIPNYVDKGYTSVGKHYWSMEFTIHHMYGDMISIMSMLSKNPTEIQKFTPIVPHPSKVRNVINICTSVPCFLADFFYFFLATKHCPLASQQLTHKQNTCLSRKLPMTLLKEIKKKTGTCVTAVLWTSIAELVLYWQTKYGYDFKEVPMAFTGQRPVTFNTPGLVNNAIMWLVSMPLLKGSPTSVRLAAVHKLFKSRQLQRHVEFSSVLQAVTSVLPKSSGNSVDSVCSNLSNFPFALKGGNNIGPAGELVFPDSVVCDYVQLILMIEGVGIATSMTTCKGSFRLNLTVDEVILKGRNEVQHLVNKWASIIVNMHKEICFGDNVQIKCAQP